MDTDVQNTVPTVFGTRRERSLLLLVPQLETVVLIKVYLMVVIRQSYSYLLQSAAVRLSESGERETRLQPSPDCPGTSLASRQG